MKTEYKILLLFGLTGCFSWALEAAIDSAFFSHASFVHELLSDSPRELYMRLATSGCFFVLGAVVAMLSRQRQRMLESTAHVGVVLAAIRGIEHKLANESDRGQLARSVCETLVDAKAYFNAWIALTDAQAADHVTIQSGLDGRFQVVADAIGRGQYPTCMRKALSQSGVLVVEGPKHNCPGCSLGSIYRGTGSLVARLEYGDRIFGVMTVALSPHMAAQKQEQALFREVALDVSAALSRMATDEQRRKAERDLGNARRREEETGFKIQQMLLFQRPPEDIAGATLAAISIPSHQVDGDFYDFFKHNDHCFDVVIADVMGKGTTAALLGAATKSYFLRAINYLVSSSPGPTLPQPRDIVGHVHREMTRRLIELESFVALFYARFDLSSGRLTYVDCGHPKPLHFQARTGLCRAIEGPNVFLGGDVNEVYEQQSIKIEPGDHVLFYSDGLVELANARSEFFGAQRLLELMRQIGRTEPAQVIDRVITDLIGFASTDGASDDLTCVAVRIKSIEPVPPLARVDMEITSSPQELSRIRDFVMGLSRRLPIVLADPQGINRLELAVNEAASNIMRHAYHGKTDQRIRLEADVFDDRLTVRLHHWGEAYEPRKAAHATRGDSQIGGFGLSIIAQCVDEVRYLPSDNGGSYVELTKAILKG